MPEFKYILTMDNISPMYVCMSFAVKMYNVLYVFVFTRKFKHILNMHTVHMKIAGVIFSEMFRLEINRQKKFGRLSKQECSLHAITVVSSVHAILPEFNNIVEHASQSITKYFLFFAVKFWWIRTEFYRLISQEDAIDTQVTNKLNSTQRSFNVRIYPQLRYLRAAGTVCIFTFKWSFMISWFDFQK